MRGKDIVITGLLMWPLQLAIAGESAAHLDARPKPLKGDYKVYGGTLSDMQPPAQHDSKVAIMVIGPFAKTLFDQLGRDKKVTCSHAPGYRKRGRGDLSCTYTKGEGYSCYFGIDIVTGKSTLGLIC